MAEVSSVNPFCASKISIVNQNQEVVYGYREWIPYPKKLSFRKPIRASTGMMRQTCQQSWGI